MTRSRQTPAALTYHPLGEPGEDGYRFFGENFRTGAEGAGITVCDRLAVLTGVVDCLADAGDFEMVVPPQITNADGGNHRFSMVHLVAATSEYRIAVGYFNSGTPDRLVIRHGGSDPFKAGDSILLVGSYLVAA